MLLSYNVATVAANDVSNAGYTYIIDTNAAADVAWLLMKYLLQLIPMM